MCPGNTGKINVIWACAMHLFERIQLSCNDPCRVIVCLYYFQIHQEIPYSFSHPSVLKNICTHVRNYEMQPVYKTI